MCVCVCVPYIQALASRHLLQRAEAASDEDDAGITASHFSRHACTRLAERVHLGLRCWPQCIQINGLLTLC